MFKIDETAAGERIRNWGTLPNVSSFAYNAATQTPVAIDDQPYGNFRYVHHAVYHFDPVTGTFGSPTPLDVGADGQTADAATTPDGKTYAVFSTTASDFTVVPTSGGGTVPGLVQWHDPTPGAGPTVGRRLPGDVLNPYTRGAVISDETGRALILAVQVHQSPTVSSFSTGGDYVVFDPVTGAEVTRLTRPRESSGFYGGVANRCEVERPAAYPDPSGRRNVWWAVERQPNLQNGYDTHVVRYTYSTAGGIVATGSEPLPSTDFAFAPDGSRAYYVYAQGSGARAGGQNDDRDGVGEPARRRRRRGSRPWAGCAAVVAGGRGRRPGDRLRAVLRRRRADLRRPGGGLRLFTTVPAGGTAAVRVTALTNDDGTFPGPSNTLAVTVRNADGTYTVTLTVTDPDGGTATVTQTIAVANLDPTIDTFAVPTTPTEGQAVTFTAAASGPAGAAGPLAYTWTITPPTGDPLTRAGTAVTFTPTRTGMYDVRLVVAAKTSEPQPESAAARSPSARYWT